MSKEYGSATKGSKWNSGEDDLWSGGTGYATYKEAREAALKDVESGTNYIYIFSGPNFDTLADNWSLDDVVEHGCVLELAEVVENDEDEDDWELERSEARMQAGMAFGCRGANEYSGELYRGDPEESLARAEHAYEKSIYDPYDGKY